LGLESHLAGDGRLRRLTGNILRVDMRQRDESENARQTHEAPNQENTIQRYLPPGVDL
jgi:hypothetical protein